jgi:prepilin-type N-terminal cleavage/methylation domain-containing protein/prepilin-type processing-associated H-X9-DG protein
MLFNNSSLYRPSSARSGFTLIELLVVIAIIAILAAILFPVFAQARDKARQSACANNLRQIGFGMRMYMDDYDGHPPAPGDDTTPGCMGRSGFRAASDPRSIPYILKPYYKTRDIWWCPTAVWGSDEAPEHRNTYFISISKAFYENPDDQTTTTAYLGWDNFVYKYWTPLYALGQPNALLSPRKYPHTGEGRNVVFLDSHVKLVN